MAPTDWPHGEDLVSPSPSPPGSPERNKKSDKLTSNHQTSNSTTPTQHQHQHQNHLQNAHLVNSIRSSIDLGPLAANSTPQPAPQPHTHHHHQAIHVPSVHPRSPASLWSKTPTLRDLFSSITYQRLTPEQKREVVEQVSDKFWYQPVAPPLQHQVRPVLPAADGRRAPQFPAIFSPQLPYGVDPSSYALDPLSQLLLQFNTNNIARDRIVAFQRAQLPTRGLPIVSNLVDRVQRTPPQLGSGHSHQKRKVIDLTDSDDDSGFHNTSSQAARMPPAIEQKSPPVQQPPRSAPSANPLIFHGTQTSMASRPFSGAVGSSNYRSAPGHPQPQKDMSNMASQSSGPTLFDRFSKQNGHGMSQSVPRPYFAPPYVSNKSAQPRPTPTQYSALPGHVGVVTDGPTPSSSRGNSQLDRFVSSSSSISFQPPVTGHHDRREPSPPFTISHDGVARVASSEIPSNLAVMVDNNRMSSTFTPSRSEYRSRDLPVQQDSPRGNFTSRIARVEIPASTPEKLALKLFEIQSHDHQSTLKKRGRPFASSEAEAAAKAKAERKRARENREHVEESVKKRPGRPAKLSKYTEVPVPEPKYAIFYCEWKDCPAELHNAETLRKHLHLKHGVKNPITKTITCLWKDCVKIKHLEDEVTGEFTEETRSDMIFGSVEEWKKHLEDSHLLNVLWYQGDGPKVQDYIDDRDKKSLRETAPWLFDPISDKQVTPSVRNQGVDYGNPKETNAKRFRKRREGGSIVYDLIDDPNNRKKDQGFEDDDQMGMD